MTEINIFLYSLSGNSAQQNALRVPVFKRFGGKGRAIDGRNIYFLLSYFFPNMSGISAQFTKFPNAYTVYVRFAAHCTCAEGVCNN